MTLRRKLAAGAVAALGLLVTAAPAPGQVQSYRTNDYGGFRDVLPPGTNGRSNAVELAAFLALGKRPLHNDDQRELYARLIRSTPGVTNELLPSLFKDASFGISPGGQARAYTPIPGLTITRDKAFGVPHVYGTSRAAAMFGLGYVAAEDRLFFMDALRHAGRGQLSSFAGGAAGNRAMDKEQWELAPYTEADLQRQVDQLDDLYGEDGRQLQRDGADYVAGVNRYINEAKVDISKQPAEYLALGRLLGADPWKMTDVIATASLVGGIFGKGGGQELTQMELRRTFIARFGARRGKALWREWAAYEDKDAPTTVRKRVFSYQATPSKAAKGGLAIADAGSLRKHSVVARDSGPRDRGRGALPGLFSTRMRDQGMSNALVVSRAESQSGRPLAVFGPQTSYFSPQILMEQDVHAPRLDARGVAFPGVNLYVQLGRGRDYAWSATSAAQDIIDTFAVDALRASGGAPTTGSTHYPSAASAGDRALAQRTRGSPSLADPTPAGSRDPARRAHRARARRGRATIRGRPCSSRDCARTYRHEIDSALGFSYFNDPDGCGTRATSSARRA